MSDNCGANSSNGSEDFSAQLNELSSVKKVIGVLSGKGGVGKSLVTSLLAVAMNKKGYHTAILDADVTGPSIPKVFGLKGKAEASELGMFPMQSTNGIEIMSINLLLPNDTDPVIWRGPILSGVVKQFWTEVIWHDVDFMFIDMPPGTGDVPLTVFQSLPVDGIIVVTSPQELVSMIVAKAVKMAEMMNIPIIGLVENMSYFRCPDNNKEYKIFGDSHIDEIAREHNLKVLAKLPVDPEIATACDRGLIEELAAADLVEHVVQVLEKMEGKQSMENAQNLKIAVASDQGMVTEHFGHCQSFMLFDTENGQITNSETVPNPGHRPGFLPVFLNEKGVKVIISGGMGAGAIDIFNEKDIEVIVGASGDARATAELYLQGALQSTGSVCHEHQHLGDCGN